MESSPRSDSPATLPRGKGVDLEFMSDAQAAQLLKTPMGGRLILWATAVFLVIALAWANWAELDEVTKGMGKVIPSSQIQVIQNLEGGIVSELKVQEGDTVEKGEVLLQIDDTRFASSLRETQSQRNALEAKAARLRAEATGEALEFSSLLQQEAASLVEQERQLYQARARELQNNSNILNSQLTQRKQELAELQAKRAQIRRSLNLVQQELQMNKPLVDAGAISEVEILRLQREVNDLKGELESTRLAIPRVEEQIEEARKKLADVKLRFRSKAQEELNATEAELAQLRESSVAIEDRVKRTAVRSPVKGTVKRLMVNTVGGVVQPGMELMEIVPLEDSLLIEAKISPRDIGFVHPGQKAVVKFTAYDFAIYGGLEGVLELISADSIVDDEGNSYYLVRVRTKKNVLESQGERLPIIAGMQAEVDIMTGKKSVLQYLMKPILKAKGRALQER